MKYALCSRVLEPRIIYYLQEVHNLVIWIDCDGWTPQGAWWDIENNYKRWDTYNDSINEAGALSFSMLLSTGLSDMLHLLRYLWVVCDLFFFFFSAQSLTLSWLLLYPRHQSSLDIFISNNSHPCSTLASYLLFITWDLPVRTASFENLRPHLIASYKPLTNLLQQHLILKLHWYNQP